MKKIGLILYCLMAALSLQAQDFDLWFANNVGDVPSVRNIKTAGSGLNWKKVEGSTIVTNATDVKKVKDMFSATRMKTRDDQKVFWKMRDDNLLCFRINDGRGTSGEFEARLRIGKRTAIKNVSSYFFINTESNTDSLFISVCRKGCGPNDTLRFTYYVMDWDNDGLLVFKLDSKRRVSGKTYQLEYQLKGEGDRVGSVHQLSLSGSTFQSFYVPSDSAFNQLYLVNEGNRVQLDQKRLVWGANLFNRLNRLWIGTNFTLDKHENRELTIFNMLGTGLFENYDTLHLQVLGEKGKPIQVNYNGKVAQGFQFNIVRVNEKGQYVPDGDMKYVAYDRKRGIHKLITRGHPAYVEVIAPGYFPAVYKYHGAADPTTKVLMKNRNSGVIRLLKGTMTADGPNIANQQMYIIKDKKEKLVEGSTTKYYYTVDSCDLSTNSASSTYEYTENGGRKSNKILHPSKTAVDKYAEIGITYSVSKSQGSAASNVANLYLHEKGKEGQDSLKLQPSKTELLDGNDYPGFQYSYFQQRYNLVGQVQKKDTDYKLRLIINKRAFKQMPYIRRLEVDLDEASKKAEEEGKKYLYTDMKADGARDGCVDMFGSLAKIDLKLDQLPGFSMAIIPTFDPFRKIFEIDLMFSAGARTKKAESGQTTTGQKMRDNQKDVMQPSRSEVKKVEINDKKGNIGIDPLSSNANNENIKKRNIWFMSELDDIFKVENNKLGAGHYVDGRIGFGWNWSKKNQMSTFYLKTLEITLGIGAFAAWSVDLGEKMFGKEFTEWFPFSAIFHCNASTYLQGTTGVRSYNYVNKQGEIYDRMYGFFFTLELTGKAGAGIAIKTNFGDPTEDAAGLFSRLLSITIGGRAGAKISFKGGFVLPFESRFDVGRGASVLTMGAAELYADIQSIIGIRYRQRAAAKLGGYWFLPDKPYNPMVPSYPNYTPESNKAPMLRSALAPQWPSLSRPRLMPQLTAESEEEAEGFSFGTLLLDEVGKNATPLFLDNNHLVTNHQKGASNPNDDRLMAFPLPDEPKEMNVNEGTPLPGDHQIQHPDISRQGDAMMLVYEEMARDITPEEQSATDLAVKDAELARQNRIVMSRKKDATSDWQRQVIAFDENVVDALPKVSMETVTDDHDIASYSERAACVWKRGQYVLPENEQLRKGGIRAFEGDLMLSIYDGEKWSEPKSILTMTAKDILKDYQVLMRNDTVLTVVSITPEGKEKAELRYLCKPVDGTLLPPRVDPLVPADFDIDLVGPWAFAGILHRADSLGNDIYVKEINMRGEYQDYGVDLDIVHYNPESVRLVSNHQINSPDDFAVVWKKKGNSIRQDGKTIATEQAETMLNCSRIYLKENLQATPYMTLGCTLDSMYIHHYDVLMNLDKITAIYTLARDDNQYSALMTNQIDFYDDFEYNITYPLQAMMDGETMPVNIQVRNTGTTAITEVTGYINQQPFEFKDLLISPFSTQTLNINYELPDNFDGFMKAHDVMVVYEDGWSSDPKTSRRHSQRRAKPADDQDVQQVIQGYGDVGCRLLSQSIEGTQNLLYIELTDNGTEPLNENYSVHVGLYPHAMADVPVTSTAEVVLHADDFVEMDGERKAYVELTVDGLEEETDTWLRARIYNDRIAEKLTGNNDNPLDAVVENLSWRDNMRMVTLLPSELDDTTGLPIVMKDLTQRKVQVIRQEEGVLVTGLEPGDFVRVFDAAGLPIYQHSHPTHQVFVPLSRLGVYLLSTGQEVVKFMY